MITNKKRVFIALSCLVLLFIMIIGISYAYYSANIKGNTSENPSLKLKSGYLSIVYEGEESKITGGSTSGTTTDLVYTKNFSITNDGVADSYFGIWIKDYNVLDSEGNTTILSRPEDWTYELTSGDTIIKTGTFPTEDEALITAYPLNMGETKDLTLTVTYNYITLEEGGTDQSADMGKILSFDVSVTQALNNLESAKEGTLLYAINQYNIVSEVSSTPGQEASLETEAVLAATEDDYGTSYYFRGNVTNNYVTYSNMCWRIVRIQGDGTIKLVLADEHGECDADTYSTSNKTTAFINDGATYMYSEDYLYSKDEKKDSLIYANSYIPTELTAWANKSVTGRDKNLDETKLETTDWCNDMSENNYGSRNTVFYGAYERLAHTTTANPTLKCNMKGLNDSKAIRYESNIGILTADEVAFAGGAYVTENRIYYLYTNANGNYYWTMSPHDFVGDGVYPYVLDVSSTGSLNSNYVGSSYAVRPAVVLQSNVTIKDGGIGTQTNPYEIN